MWKIIEMVYASVFFAITYSRVYRLIVGRGKVKRSLNEYSNIKKSDIRKEKYMEYKGLYTKENQSVLLDVARRIDSSARESYNSKNQWYVLLYEDKPAENRASIWITPKHIRIYGGKYTPIFSKLPDEPDYKYIYRERRITFQSIDEALDFMKSKLFKPEVEIAESINIPLPPQSVSADGFVVICPRCDTKFKRADRCPVCGQLIKYDDKGDK